MTARNRRRATPTGSGPTPARRVALPARQLQLVMLAHLRAHPGLDFSPAELANVLGRPGSRGAVINACKHWVALGQAVRTLPRPQRYQAAP